MATMRLRWFASLVAVASGGLIAFAPSTVAQAAPPTVTYYSAKDQGVVSPVRATAAHSSSSTSGTASTRPRGARSLHPSGAEGGQAHSGPGSTAGSKASVLANFNGVSSLDSQLTNYNAKFEPPDVALCQGNGFVLEPVNSAYKIYHTNGSAIEGPFNINDIFNEGGQEFTSDPRCHFDPTTNTWFAEILFISADGLHSHQDIAVNTTGDPTNIWTEYHIDTTNPGGVACPCFGDQPRIGIDQYNVYISTDEFSIAVNQFNGGQLYAFSKSDLIAGKPVHFVHFANLSLGGQLALAIEPALSTGTPNAEYFLNSFDPNGTFDTRIGVWAMTDQQDVATGDKPILSATVISSETYGLPVGAAQKGSASLLDAGDDRMQQAQYIAGNVWGELTTGVTIPGDSAQRDGAAWFQVTPTLTGNHIGTVTIANQGYVVKKGNYLIYPALQADASGRAAMVFTETSATRFPSAAYAVINTGGTQFGAPIVAANGNGPYDTKATRWGDYSWAVLDPITGKFWADTEYIPPKSSWTTTGARNWGTRVLEISVS